MSDKTNKQNDEMLKVALGTMDTEFTTTEYNEDEHSDIVFYDLNQLNSAFKEKKHIVEYKKDGTKLLVRKLTAGEFYDVQNSLISTRLLKAMSKHTPGSKEYNKAEEQSLKEILDKAYEKQVKCVQRSVYKPEGITEAMLIEWDREKLDFFYRFVTNKTEVNTAVDMFHDEDGAGDTSE